MAFHGRRIRAGVAGGFGERLRRGCRDPTRHSDDRGESGGLVAPDYIVIDPGGGVVEYMVREAPDGDPRCLPGMAVPLQDARPSLPGDDVTGSLIWKTA